MARQLNKNISEEKVVAEFAVRHAMITRLAIVAALITGVAFFFLYKGLASNTTAIILFIAIFILAAFVNIKVWRCPSCGGHLGKLYLGLKQPKHCPNCGIKLVE